MTDTHESQDARPGTARLCAARAVQHVLRDQEQLEVALSRQSDYTTLEPRDRAFARLIAATVFRRMGQIDAALKPYLKQKPGPFPHAILRCGAAQILFLKTAPHAAVGESVALLKRSSKTRAYSGMVNAVLRRVVDDGMKHAVKVPPRANLPGWVRGTWESAYGRADMGRMAMQLTKEPPLDITVKSDAAGWAERLGGQVLAPHSVRLPSAGHVPSLEGFDAGEWWVQDLAASLPVVSLGDISGLTVLDMCAAPGGKTLQLASSGAIVTAIDRSEERLERVTENLHRTKLNAEIVASDAIEWGEEDTRQFDIVVLDAPCSATGTFRRHPDVLYNKTPKDVGSLVRLQRRLFEVALRKIKPGGRIIYCTCSLQYEEGEAQLKKFLSENGTLELASSVDIDIFDEGYNPFENGYLRLLPHVLGEKGGADGFFSAIVKHKQ